MYFFNHHEYFSEKKTHSQCVLIFQFFFIAMLRILKINAWKISSFVDYAIKLQCRVIRWFLKKKKKKKRKEKIENIHGNMFRFAASFSIKSRLKIYWIRALTRGFTCASVWQISLQIICITIRVCRTIGDKNKWTGNWNKVLMYFNIFVINFIYILCLYL